MESRRKKDPSSYVPSGRPAPSPRGVKALHRERDVLASIPERASLLRDTVGRPTHALIPYDDYMYLVALQAAREGEKILDDPDTEWVELDDARAILNADSIAKIRKSRGLTQAQLGKLVGMPQSQISRLEKNPDASSLRLIKKIAKALKIPPSELV